MWFGMVEILFGTERCFHPSSGGLHDDSWPWPALFMLGLILLVAGKITQGNIVKSTGDRRAEMAKVVLERLRSGRPVGPFSIYLRSFETTGRLVTKNPRPKQVLEISVYHPRTFEVESSLADLVAGFAPLIALGKPSDDLGWR